VKQAKYRNKIPMA